MAAPSQVTIEGAIRRLAVVVRGAVQGVGFRPFVFRLATELRLSGWVLNSAQGVFLEVEGEETVLREFLRRLEAEKPAIAFIQSLEARFLDPVGYTGFEIRESAGGAKTALILPDIATCPDCLHEISDPANRRHRYPFTNCTNCGPRFTIIESLPYDRPRTTMKQFTMCADCLREYHDPRDRRFHAQPNACPACGPHLELWAPGGKVPAKQDTALLAAAQAIRDGKILALKGLGGFHLLVDARNEAAVRELRKRKRREEKPLALMFPSLETGLRYCTCSKLELRLLRSPESPIVLLHRKGEDDLAESLAPGNPNLGVMLPYTPLHHLLLHELGFPVVATSGNLSEEPICIDEHEALARLSGIADLYLVHNRPILRHVDDSIVREMAGRELVLRRARGFAPLPILLQHDLPALLGVGPHQKNTIATSVGPQVFVSQHIGDLETAESLRAFERVNTAFRELYELRPAALACDLHPDYLSTQFARRSSERVIGVQHHYAHVLACMAENYLDPPVLGIAWDGSGYGPDGTVWGGEFLRVTATGYERVGHLRTFPLPGGERAVKEPRRVALGVLYEIFGDAAFSIDSPALQAFTAEELRVFRSMLQKGLNSPLTSSAGRLFDAVSALIGLRQVCGFEGQAAMELEFAAGHTGPDATYDFSIQERNGVAIVDWEPMVRKIVQQVSEVAEVSEVGSAADQTFAPEAVAGAAKHVIPPRPPQLPTPPKPPTPFQACISRMFHDTLARMMVGIAQRVGELRVVLSGGCFQNRYLTEVVIHHLQAAGFRAYWHQRIPPNDGGIALGQVVGAAAELARER